MIYYIGGGVKKENSVRYLTAETPPADDNSNKVPTTEWVQEKLNDTVGGGMNATVGAITASGNKTYAPSGGGTYWCYGETKYTYWDHNDLLNKTEIHNGSYASGAVITNPNKDFTSYSAIGFGIKIA